MPNRRALVVAVWLCGSAAVCPATAQTGDPTARRDVEDVLGAHPHDEADEDGPRSGAITAYAALGVAYSTNAAWSRSNSFGAAFATPTLGLEVAPIQAGRWSVGAGAKVDADLYITHRANDLGEGRLEGYVYATRSLGRGAVTLEAVALTTRSDDFSNHDFNLQAISLAYELTLAGADVSFSVDQDASDLPELRRRRLNVIAARDLVRPFLGYDVSIKAEARFSDFTDGLNSERNDVMTAGVLTAERLLTSGWALEWRAALLHRFSNRDAARFGAIELAAEVVRRF